MKIKKAQEHLAEVREMLDMLEEAAENDTMDSVEIGFLLGYES